ncbi:hypothetical protein D8674_014003 [Pyrus ussuriensis x Pyrus communis]|uniref:DUF8204 domain-containing protein n=1 Tax=Pyrus ussuriensis x Pyrus communis TaxID=2448454 RepID=A0A5N5H4S2_9ROSA|nr:hypothetical protein D8674_014003 [Pyrus ussuriensis x Pyrus communis]
MDTNNNGKDELPDQSKASKKGRSCKGTLYYSSALKSKAYNPLCVGIPRAIPEVPQSIVAETEMKASKDDRHLTEFRYACAGYSLYLDRITKDHSEEQPELPVCYGLKLLVGKRMVQKTPAAAPVSAHVHHKRDDHEVPQTQRQQPTQSAGSLFFNRFTRNADLVASGVTKNIRKVGKYVKGSIYKFLYSYRGRPK